MRAVIQERYGSPDDLRLGEVPQPVVGDDEVLVQVLAASVQPDVWHVVTGWPFALRFMGAGLFRPKNPIPGTDMAGIVESVGRNVTRFQSGDAVFGETIASMQWTNGGAYAEYVSVRQDLLALKPANVTFEQAASVPASGFIALLNLRGGSVLWPGQQVLINGAGGGVGSLALQIAKAHGAHVSAVDTKGKLKMLHSLGADEVVDCAQTNFTRLDARYDLIFDVPGNYSISECRRALRPDGKYVLIGHEGFGASGKRVFGLIPLFLGLILRSLFVRQLRLGRSSVPSKQDSIAVLRELLKAEQITPIVDSTFSLAEVSEAFRHAIEDELLGKVIITPRDPSHHESGSDER